MKPSGYRFPLASCAAVVAAAITATASTVHEAQAQRLLSCPGQYREFVRSLTALEGQLGVGVNHTRYETFLAKTRAAYDAVPFKTSTIPCLRLVGVPGEHAMNDYTDADKAWTACLQRVLDNQPGACDSGTLADRTMQRYWDDATASITRAVDSLG